MVGGTHENVYAMHVYHCDGGARAGRTHENAFVIVDEAQNASLQQLKLAATRFGGIYEYMLLYLSLIYARMCISML